jgi:hypothetical protein
MAKASHAVCRFLRLCCRETLRALSLHCTLDTPFLPHRFINNGRNMLGRNIGLRDAAKRPSAGEHLELPKSPANLQRFCQATPASAHAALTTSFSRPDFVR